MQLERHQLSKLWPDMSDVLLAELREDIRKNGQRHPITIYDGQIIDGWHRYRACTELKIKPQTDKFKGTPEQAADLVNSLNGQRRNVTESQRAFATTGCCQWAQGQKTGVARATPGPEEKTNKEMAALSGTIQDTVIRAKKVHKSGSKALKEAVQAGNVSVKKAASVVNLPKSEQLAAATAKPERVDFDDDEVATAEAMERELAASIEKIMAADDRLAASYIEIKRQAAEIAALKISRDGFMNGKGEMVRLLKKEQSKNERLTRECAKLQEEIRLLQQRRGQIDQENGRVLIS